MAVNDLNLFVNLLVKNEQAIKTLNTDLNKVNETVAKTNKNVSTLTSGFGKFIAFFVGAAGIRKAIQEFDQLDQATDRLSVALERNNRLGQRYNSQLQEQAANLSRVNNFTVAQVRNLQAMTANLGLAGDQTVALNDAIANLADRSGQDLATVTKGVESLIRTGEAARGLRLEGINTSGFQNLNTNQRAAAFSSQVQIDTTNGNELQQLLVQINNLFANLGKTLNTVLGPALRFINNLLSAINKSPILSSITSGTILGGGLILAIGALIRALGVATAVFAGAQGASGLVGQAGSIAAGSFAGSAAAGGGGIAAMRFLRRAVAVNQQSSIAFGSFGGAFRLSPTANQLSGANFGLTGRATGTLANGLSRLGLANGSTAAIAGITSVVGLIGRFAGVVGLIVSICYSLKSAFEGLVDIIGPTNIDKIKRSFSDLFSFLGELPGKLEDGLASLIPGSASYEELQKQRKDAAQQAADQAQFGGQGGGSSGSNSFISDALEEVQRERQRLEQGFIGRRNVQGEINLANAGTRETDRVSALRAQNELIQARIANLIKEREIYGEEKANLDAIGELNETDLERSKELNDIRGDILDKIIQLRNESEVNLKVIEETKFNLQREADSVAMAMDLEIERVSINQSFIDLKERNYQLDQQIIDLTKRGVLLDDAKIQRLRDIYEIQYEIAAQQERITESQRESEISLLRAANKRSTNPEFGDSNKNFREQLQLAEDRVKLATDVQEKTQRAFNQGNASREDLDNAIFKVEEATAAVNALREASSELSDIVGNNLVSAFDKIVDGTSNAADAISNIVNGIVEDIAKLFIRIASFRIATSLFGAGTAAGGGFSDIVSFFPTGGMVGPDDGPQVSADGHRLVAVQPGELILNKAQQRALATNARSSAPMVYNINTFSDNDLYRAMQRTGGQNVTVNNIRSNRSAVRSTF